MLRPVLHLALHGIIPGIVAGCAFRRRWKSAWLIMAATIVVDIDHLLADPVYDPNRCSLGFHPLHSMPALIVYPLLVAFPSTRLAGLGLVLHMALDALDCIMMTGTAGIF